MSEYEVSREMTFEEECKILEEDMLKLLNMEVEHGEPPFANLVACRAYRCIQKLLIEIQQYRELGTVKELKMDLYKEGNADNIDKAVYGLDIFTKNWCMNCEEIEKKNNLTFRCKECNFSVEDGTCLIKYFANNHKHNYPMKNFGSMGSL